VDHIINKISSHGSGGTRGWPAGATAPPDMAKIFRTLPFQVLFKAHIQHIQINILHFSRSLAFFRRSPLPLVQSIGTSRRVNNKPLPIRWISTCIASAGATTIEVNKTPWNSERCSLLRHGTLLTQLQHPQATCRPMKSRCLHDPPT
jgi:hypothetical protein